MRGIHSAFHLCLALTIAMFGTVLLPAVHAQRQPEQGFVPYNNAPAFLAAVEADIDVVFKEAHGVEIRLDVYRPKNRPEGAPALPVLVNLHGGGWKEGTKFGFALNTFLGDTFLPAITRGELAVVSPAYRFADPLTPLPAIIGDCFDALRWIRAEGPARGLDPDRVVLIGHSAGAHLALMMSLARAENFPCDRAGPTATVRGVIALAAPTDFTAGGRDRVDLFGATLALSPVIYRQASPITHVRADAPPMLLICGTRDTLLPHSERFHAAAIAAGARIRFVAVENAPHRLYQPRADWNPDGATLQRLLREFTLLHTQAPSTRP